MVIHKNFCKLKILRIKSKYNILLINRKQLDLNFSKVSKSGFSYIIYTKIYIQKQLSQRK